MIPLKLRSRNASKTGKQKVQSDKKKRKRAKYETPVNLPMGKNSWAKYLVWVKKESGALREKIEGNNERNDKTKLNKSLDVQTRGGLTKP